MNRHKPAPFVTTLVMGGLFFQVGMVRAQQPEPPNPPQVAPAEAPNPPQVAPAETPNPPQVAPAETLPPAKSSHDPQPIAPTPAMTNPEGITKQAGVGGTQAYARVGVLELGGSAGFQESDGLTAVNVSPSIGWFIVDNLELSAIVGFNYAKAKDQDSQTFFKAVIEPSYHLPFNNFVYGFFGLGFGAAYNGKDTGFDLAPRLGANFLVGRSGILTPAIVMDYSTSNIVNTSQGTLLAVKAAYGMNIGYTVMW